MAPNLRSQPGLVVPHSLGDLHRLDAPSSHSVTRNSLRPHALSIENHLIRSANILRKTADCCGPAIERSAEMIVRSFQSGGKLLICGNGGSAAESQHLAAEFTHRLSSAIIRRALPAISLTTDTSFLTACANDDGFVKIFSRQIEAIGKDGDVLLGISTSGSSKNILAAFEQGRQQGLQLIALCGQHGVMSSLVDEAICVPADDTQSIQEAHLAIVHILCAIVEQSFL